MPSILIVKSSPREHGNSAALADQVRVSAEAEGASVETVYLHALDIHPCNGCDACRNSGDCAVQDDMQGLYTKLLHADALVLASPIYFFTYNAQLKVFIDRWYALWNGKHDVFKGKPIGILLTYGDSDPYTSGAINAIHTLETMFRFLEADIVECLHGSAPELGSAQSQPELMRRAARLGRRLAQAAKN